jgi:peptidoglycan/LPS O-acetylase OafA/YrhL
MHETCPPVRDEPRSPSPNPDFNPAQRNRIIDFLRGLAILMVVVSHLGLLKYFLGRSDATELPWFGRSVGNVSQGLGYYGVSLFFVVSGFLITNLALKRYGRLNQIDFSGFWWMRFSRIMPMLLLSLFGLVLFHAMRVKGFVFQDGQMVGRAVFSVLSFRFNEQFNGDSGLHAWNPLWSLSVEEMFYLAFPFIGLALNGRAAVAWVAMFVVATSEYLRITGQTDSYSALGCMDLLALGAIAAYVEPARLRKYCAPWVRRGLGWALLSVAFANLAYWALAHYPTDAGQFGPFWCGLSSVAILVASQLVEPGRFTGLAIAPIGLLGAMSYEIYLVHMPVTIFTTQALNLAQPWAILPILFFSVLAFRFYSSPLNRILRRLGHRHPDGAGPTARERKRLWIQGSTVTLSAGLAIWIVAAAMTWHRREARATVVIQKLSALADGVVEPVAYVGSAGAADLIFIRHLDSGHVCLGVDHWGGQVVNSPPRSFDELCGKRIDLVFGDRGVEASVDGRLLLYSPTPAFRFRGRVHFAQNDIGFAFALPHADARLVYRAGAASP